MSLKRKAFAAGRWTTASAVVRSALNLIQMTILARLLTPADFGLMAVAGALLAAIGLLADLGLSRALIHFPLPSRQVLSSLYWLNLATGILLMLLMAAAAPAVSALYDEAALTPLLLVVSTVFPLSALGQQFRTLAEKRLDFAALARIEITSGFLGIAAAASVAWLGGGVYALAVAIVVPAALSSLLACWRLSDFGAPLRRARFSETIPYLRFGGYLIGENFANTVRMQSDVFIGGFILGPSGMGVYALPRELCLRLSHTVVNPVVTRIGFPVMAQIQHDPAALKSAYLQILRVTASFNFPIYVALAVFAPEIVAILFGPQWESAAPYLRVFAFWGLVRSAGNPVGSLLHAVGRVRLAMSWNLTWLILLPPVFWLSAKSYGVEGLAWSMLVTQVLLFLPAWRFLVYPFCRARFGEYMGHLAPPLAAAAIAGGFALVGAAWADTALLRLLLGIATGSVLYLGLSFWLNRWWLETLLQIVRAKAVPWSPEAK